MSDATIKFLTGRRVTVSGVTFRDDKGDVHDDVFFVVGKAPAHFGPDMIRVQDPVDGMFHEFPVDSVHIHEQGAPS